MTTNTNQQNYYKNMNWKPKLGSIYCITNKETNKIDLFYEVVELIITDYMPCLLGHTNEAEYLHITFKVYDYRYNKNVNIYYVKLQPLCISDNHKKRDLVLYFQYRNGENKLATHTITDGTRPIIYKTTEDTQAIRTKLNKLLIDNTYLCKHNAFTSSYSVENFYILYNILHDTHRPFSEFMMPHKSLYDKLSDGDYVYDWIDYTKQKFNEMCYFKNICDKLKNPNHEDNDNSDIEEEDSEEVILETNEEVTLETNEEVILETNEYEI